MKVHVMNSNPGIFSRRIKYYHANRDLYGRKSGHTPFAQRALLFIFMLWILPRAQEHCEFIITECPLQFNGDTIDVPEKVIAMGPKVHGCESDSATQSEGPPSIVFLIDNSASMTGSVGNVGPRDQWGSRYAVVADLIDSIAEIHPGAEIGIVVFREYLYFDTRSTENYAQFFRPMSRTYDNNGNQSFLPLMRLDSTYSGNLTGLQIIKEVLATDTFTTNGNTYVDLIYEPVFSTTGYTNINIGMLATREAFASAQNPGDRQFVIFLSDGEPLGDRHAGLNENWFQQGDSMPTTFTVFFNDSGVTTVPQSLDTMTANIQNNNYSGSNPESKLWSIETSHNALRSLIMTNIMDFILMSEPSAMSITGISLFDSTTTYVDNYFILNERIPLQPDLTPFSLDMVFRYTDHGSGESRDTIVDIDFHVRRVADSTAPPPGIAFNCWPAPTLQLFYNGTSVSQVQDSMGQLEVRFTTGDSLVTSASVALISSIDSESVSLTTTGQYWSQTFMRSTGLSGTPINAKYEHTSDDSIVIIYRNPELPLDTVRCAIPYVPPETDTTVPTDTIQVTAIVRDTNSNGQFDRIDFLFPDTTTLLEQLPDMQAIMESVEFVTEDGQTIPITPVELVRYDRSTIHIILQENNRDVSYTGWQNAQIALSDVSLTTNGNPVIINTIIDSAGPVVTDAVMYPATTGSSAYDTIRISFSEAIDCQQLMSTVPESAFVYIDNNIPNDTALQGAVFTGVCPNSSISETIVLIPSGGFEIIPLEDKIGFKGNSPYVVDTSGTRPPLNGPIVPIRLGISSEVQLLAYPNPIQPDKEINPNVRMAYANVVKARTHGVIVGIDSKVPLKTVQVGSYGTAYGKADIYDAVGNVVRLNLPVEKTDKPGVYGIYWDVKNRNRRLVGNGTYLFRVKTTDVSGKKVARRIKIGVQR